MLAEVERIFREAGAMLEGHFLLSSGLHSSVYWEKFRVLQCPKYAEQLCALIARHFQPERIEVVAGSATGGIIVAYEVARQLGVRGIFTEEEGKKRVFRRGFGIDSGERVLVVDDILTTGGSVQRTMAEVKRLDGVIMGVGVLADRSNGGLDFGVPLFSCYRASVPTYSPQDCPLCADGIPLSNPGSSEPPSQ